MGVVLSGTFETNRHLRERECAMRSLLRRALLATALGLGVTTGLGRAEEKLAAPMPAPTSALPVETAPPQFAPEMGTEAVPEEQAAGHGKHKILHFIASHFPLTCYGHHNDFSCGSLHSEYAFLFGSCRQFYGERCLKQPPLSPVPGFDPKTLTFTPPGAPGPVYGYELAPPGYTPPGYAPQSGCGCR